MSAVEAYLYAQDWRKLDPDALRRQTVPADRARAAQFRFPDDQLRHLAAWRLTRRVLGEWLNAPADSLSFERQCARCGDPDHGKPRLAGLFRNESPSFSISHAQDRIVVAVCSQSIGVDLEQAHLPDEWRAIAREFFDFGDRILLDLEEADVSAQCRFFTRLWTRMEARAKRDGAEVARRTTSRKGDFEADFDLDDDYVGAVSCRSPFVLLRREPL